LSKRQEGKKKRVTRCRVWRGETGKGGDLRVRRGREGGGRHVLRREVQQGGGLGWGWWGGVGAGRGGGWWGSVMTPTEGGGVVVCNAL